MRARRLGARFGAVLGAAALAVTLPAVPASAQQSPTTSATPSPVDNKAVPPPLDPNWPVPPVVGPDAAYAPKTNCIASASDQRFDLKNTPWGQQEMQFNDLHKFSQGEGIVVAVIDTGVRRHNFLTVTGGGDFVIAGDNGLNDCDGHGTEVAGIIAAHPQGDQIGFVGMAPKSSILSIRQSSANYEGKRPTPTDPDPSPLPAGTLETLAQAVVSAADQGAKVINMSVDSCRDAAAPISNSEKNLQAALRYAYEKKDVVLVASAGNYGDECASGVNANDPTKPDHLVLPPWFSDYVISVAAIQENGDPADFSVPGPWVTVAAPGTKIISLDPTTNDGLVNLQVVQGKAQEIRGTSFAAPYVSGLAALIRSYRPNLTARQVTERIKLTAIHPAAPGGRDNRIGYGMINPVAALTSAIPEEQGVQPDKPVDMKAELPAEVVKNWAPMQVAVIGSAGGLLLLLLTLFIVHTVRRNRGGRGDVRGMA